MSTEIHPLPDGFVVRLHEDVRIGAFLVSGTRVVRVSAAARGLLRDRELVVDSPDSGRLAGRLLDLDLADPVPDLGITASLNKVTVVVPVRDNASGVDRLLASVGASVCCVVVDDASADPGVLAGVVAGRGELLRLDHNVGPAAARTAGLREVRTPFVAFVDSDVDVTADALRQLLRHFADPSLAAVAPRVRSTTGTGWLGAYERASGSLDLGSVPATTRRWSAVSYVPSACLLARVDDVRGGFDPALRSGEDVDLVWRLTAAGRRVRHAAEIEVRHDMRPTVRAWLGRKAFYGTSAGPLARRHGDLIVPAVLTPAVAVAVAGCLLQRRWSVAAAGVALVLAARRAWSSVPDLPPIDRRHVLRSTAGAQTRQAVDLVMRHWAPATVMLSVVSARARRAALFLTVVDGVVAHRSVRPDLDVVRFTLARRAEHLAYGAGLWAGAARARTARCLVPAMPRGQGR